MSRRTTTERVIELGNIASSANVTPYIDTASSVVDEVEDNDQDNTLTTARKELIERWLSVHFYKVQNPDATSQSLGGASKSYDGRGGGGEGFKATSWGKQAVALDTTGFLDSYGTGRPQIAWLGTSD